MKEETLKKYIGNTYGVLTVLSLDHEDYDSTKQVKRSYFKCKCNRCGAITIVRTDRFGKGKYVPKSCSNCINDLQREIAHKKYKPRLLNDLSPNRVPIYSEVTSFVDDFGNPEIIDIPFENRFYHFYNSEKTDHSHSKDNTNPITYNKFRKEEYELENLLGLQFKQIRQRLRDINQKNKEQSVR